MKSILPFLVLLIISITATGQRFTGGILVGFNACQVDGDTYAGYNKFGFTAGAFTSTRLSTHMSGELQIRFMQKGANKKVTENDLSKYTSKLNYIEVPVLLRLHQTEKISWHLGPGFGYLFDYSVEDENGPLHNDAISFRKFELSGIAGFQYLIMEKLAVSVTFSYSVMPIADHPNDPLHFRQPGLYNNLFSMVFSYSL
jgi:opacity protein-like surface antigen